MNNGARQFSDNLQVFLDQVVSQAAVALEPSPLRKVVIAPGAQVAFDDCCAGQVWARVSSIIPPPSKGLSQPFGLRAELTPFLAATIELGVVRCAHVFSDSSGQAPSAEEITSDGIQAVDDMAALLSILRCNENVRNVVAWTPLGPEGGCHGGAWTFTVWLANCLEC